MQFNQVFFIYIGTKEMLIFEKIQRIFLKIANKILRKLFFDYKFFNIAAAQKF